MAVTADAMVRIEEGRPGARAIEMITGLAPTRTPGAGGGGHQARGGQRHGGDNGNTQAFHPSLLLGASSKPRAPLAEQRLRL